MSAIQERYLAFNSHAKGYMWKRCGQLLDMSLTLQENGIKVIPWTANDEKTWENLLELQVDGIITDDPKALIEYLKSRNI